MKTVRKRLALKISFTWLLIASMLSYVSFRNYPDSIIKFSIFLACNLIALFAFDFIMYREYK